MRERDRQRQGEREREREISMQEALKLNIFYLNFS